MNEQICLPMKKKKYWYAQEDKSKWWGEGEWVYEPDELEFTYLDFDCHIRRVTAKEPNKEQVHIFGGHLCGYVRIPDNHPYFHKKYEDIDIDCHGGLTYGEIENDHWIGFDCAHSGDYLPSSEYLKKTNQAFSSVYKAPNSERLKNLPIFNPTYKNMKYCIDQCMGIVEQLIQCLKSRHDDKTIENREIGSLK